MTRAALLALVAAALVAPVPVAAQETVDVRLVQSIHHDGRFSDPGPELEGRPTIPDEIWFVYDMFNDSGTATNVTLRIDTDSFRYGSRYDNWSVPMERTGGYWQGDADDCSRDFVCKVRLRAGQSYRVMIWAEANAPGPFSIGARLTSSVTDSDPSNNTASYDTRVVCAINGTDGSDHLVATDEPDSICARGGNDTLVAVGGKDKIFGQAGNDILSGAPGNNQVFLGGSGKDTVTFARSPRRVDVSLAYRTGGGRALIAIEAVIGSRYNDYLTGLMGADRIEGGPGDDRIAGRTGADVMIGGKGADRFISVDQARDVVKGSAGRDVCQADSDDRVDSAERVSEAPFYLDPPPGS